MADGDDGIPAPAPPRDFGQTYRFPEVFEKELESVARRRVLRFEHKHSRRLNAHEHASLSQELRLEEESKDVGGQPIPTPSEAANLIGLSLSGGGIRSAAFCLGALQALDAVNALERVDYLSTVSGGGYIGCSLTASLEASASPGSFEFPFRSRLQEDEPSALQQIRNYSNYLFPRGAVDLLDNASIYMRGLLVNFILVAGVMSAAIATTLLYYALRDGLRGINPETGWLKAIAWIFNPFGVQYFHLGILLALLLALTGVVWALFQSFRTTVAPIADGWTKTIGFCLLGLFAVLFCELQPFILDGMRLDNSATAAVINWINKALSLLAPVGAVIGFLASKLGESVKSAAQSPKMTAQIKWLLVQSAIYGGGLILPVAIWMIYLNAAYRGLVIGGFGSCGVPEWFTALPHNVFWCSYSLPMLCIAVAAIFILLSLVMRPNANSLHPLYRDRLSKAFLFVPQPTMGKCDLPEFDPRLSQIKCHNGPYHLINAALNVQESKTANRRGRNADFFLFSPKFVGSKATDYVATCDVENIDPGLDLGTAMAVSGAAVSSSMGAQSIKPLTATLALLNIRLGYWLRNPLRLKKAKPPANPENRGWSEFRRRNNLFANYYFLLEIFGQLTESRKSVYLTDGGHIENLGIYELLRRRCSVIIAIDAEADSQMAFGSFNTLERYALIDLGVRIDLPWQKIADAGLATSEAIDDTGEAPKHKGPHCAIGEVTYPNNRKGILVYIKASLTGDENDYILDYKKRNNDFPHETTLDQWFTEEQFEAYRALGFHAAYGFFSGGDDFACIDGTKARSQVELLNQLLGL
jgi:hypothetical protein